ncbi:MAG: nitroreductase family deazaflavin-dependent oxidoreductase, partial [Candidatus Rokubacteria bacterium]|nr:nitroreductase family deazaflavin-dependent oxidoreductase [Candidatus Rokubacteria bacterium]
MSGGIFASLVNAAVGAILRSRLHGLLGRSLVLLTFTGRRTGRRRTIPVMYAEGRGAIVVVAGRPGRKRWWRNLRGGAPVTLRRPRRGRRGRRGGRRSEADLSGELPRRSAVARRRRATRGGEDPPRRPRAGTGRARPERAARVSGSAAPLPRAAGEPPVYRPFALLAFAVALVAGVPLGIWMLARLYLGGGPIPPAWLPLHAHLQVFGFFGVLILGVAQHLVPRFAGRPVTRSPASTWLFGAVSAAVLARVAGTIAGRPGWVLAATLVEAGAFLGFAAWVWRSLAAPPLSVTRTHLGLGAGWLVAALAAEAVLRWRALGPEGAEPDPAGMRAVYLAGLLGGVVGWIVGVALRAGPMFVPGWRVPGALARGAPWALALGVLTAVAGELGPWDASTATALAKLGESVGLATVAAVALAGGLLRRAPRALPILGRGGPETRIFRLAVLSAALAAAGSATAAALAWRSIPLSLLADALR